MKAVRWHARNDVRVEEVADARPPDAAEVRIAVEWAGICGTDREEWRSGPHAMQVGAPHPLTGQMAPIVIGHEVSGIVQDVGADVRELKEGDLVAVDGLIGCDSCYWCQKHLPALCVSLASIGFHADGGVAEMITVEARSAIVVDPGTGSDDAALAEPLAVAVRALRRGRFSAGETVAIFGSGMIGLAAVRVARYLGAAHVSLITPSVARRSLALGIGVDRVFDLAEPGLQEVLRDAHHGRGPDLVIEAAGTPRAVEAAIRAPRKGGRTVLVGLPVSPVTLGAYEFVLAEREIIASLSHVWDEDFSDAVRFIAEGLITANEVGAARIPLDAAVEQGLGMPSTFAGAKVLVGPGLT